METQFSPLTLTETRDIINLKAAYGQFWRSQKFAKGYDSPFCSRADVEKALSEAAEIVVRLRSHLDRVHTDRQKKRVLGGSSQEHLFALDIADTPCSFEPEKFARDLVHATLRDSQGYVEDLDEETVDSFIGLVRAYHAARSTEQRSTSEQCEALYNDVLHQWSRDQQLLSQALPADAAERAAAFDAISLADLQSLKSQLAAVEETLRSLRLNRMRITRSPFLDVPDTPFPVDPADEARAEAYAPTEQPTLCTDTTPTPCTDATPTPTPTPTDASTTGAEDDAATTAVEAADDEDAESDVIFIDSNGRASTTPTEADAEAEAEAETEAQPAVADDEETQQPIAAQDDESNNITEQESEAAEDPEEQQLRKEAFIAIEKVASHVDQVASEFKGVLGEVEPLWSEESALRSRPIESLKKIEGLHSTVVGYSEELLQDLLRLDDIEVDPQARAERKRRVIAIQELMDDLDGVASKLKSLKDVLKVEVEKVRENSPERAPSPSSSSSSSPSSSPSHPPSTPTSPPERAQQQVPTGSSTASPTQLSSAWEKLKLDLQWDKDSSRGGYLLRTMIPGLDRDKIKLELAEDGSAFTISGCRAPTAHEEQELRQYIRRRYRYPPSEENSLLLRVASGRYGSFRNTFTLPNDALPDQIRSSYERGILQIEVPRRQTVQPRAPPQVFGRHPGYYGRPAYPSRQGAFFNDRDLWW